MPPPSNAIDFVAQQKDSEFSLIFSGNLENNMLFQPGYSKERGTKFHRDIAQLLQEKGIYVFTTNEVFFNDVDLTNPKSVRGVLQESGLDILYKATQYTHTLQKNGQLVLTENCGIITAKRDDYDCLPNYQKTVDAVRQHLDRYKNDLQCIEDEGPLSNLQEAIVSGQTNIAVVKIAPNKYHWFNIQGNYKEVFPRLAQIGDGFYPNLF